VGGTFTIQELGKAGSSAGRRLDGAQGELFEWTAGPGQAGRADGGAKAIPRQAWEMGGKLRTVRTDYSGAKDPSEQVLGPSQEPQTFTGVWDDRWNFAGYAVAERKRFEAMCERGNLVQIGFQDDEFRGLITEWKFRRRLDYRITYSFTVSIHGRTDSGEAGSTAPETVRSSAQAFDEISALIEATAVSEERNRARAGLEGRMVQGVADSAKGRIATQLAARDTMGDTLDGQQLTVAERTSKLTSPFRQLATQARTIAGSASGLMADLTAARSDIDMTAESALSLLAFEEYTRTLRFQARILFRQSDKAAAELDKRAKPDAQRIYRPARGENLYGIALRFYGTAQAWRLIAERNNLTAFELSGDEVLIIPERGTG